jgi:hypothetical protein
MLALKQLIEIVSPNKIKKINLLPPETSKISKLYHAIHKSKVSSELEGIVFQRTIKDELDIKKFPSIKSELYNRLINLLLLIDSNKAKYKNRLTAYSNCYKANAAVNILLARGARLAAITLAKKTIRISEKYEFTDISLNLSKCLMVYYGEIKNDAKKFQYYSKNAEKLLKILEAETRVEKYNVNVTTLITNTRSFKEESLVYLEKYSTELKSITDQYQSYKLNQTAYNIFTLYHELSGEYEEVIKMCDQALAFFKSRKTPNSRSIAFLFNFRKLPSLILLNRIDKALQTSKICLENVTEGYTNWYKLLEVQFIVFNHSNQFDKAYDTYLKAVSHSNFSKQYSEVREIWYINEAYVYYFHVKAAISTPVNKRLKKFRLNKFLNEVPVFSRDKRGMNINILILHVLLLLHRKEYEKVADRAEALRAYTKRYLRKDETFRSNCFIKMLIQIPASNFHKAAVSRNTADLYKKLTSVGIAHNKSAEVEIVPYETLWEFALSSLDYKLH